MKNLTMTGLLFSIFLLVCGVSIADDNNGKIPFPYSDTDENITESVQILVDAVLSDEATRLSDLILYPLRREYPLSYIENSSDFIQHYDEIFGAKAKEILSKIDPVKDWSIVGWRGAMIHHGMIWLTEPGIYDRSKIFAINHMSEKGRALFKKLKDDDRNKLHPSLGEYIKPIYECKTRNYLIRIDKCKIPSEKSVGGYTYNYRYASWSLPKTKSDQPDLVLFGTGPMGSYERGYYIFTNNEFRYLLLERDKYEEPKLGQLSVYKKDQVILEQNVLELGPF